MNLVCMVVPSSLGLGPCLGGLAPMWALRGAGGPEPHPTGAAWLLAADGPLAHGQLGLVHGLALHGFHGLVLGVAAAGLHGLHGLAGLLHVVGKLHGLHGLHVGTLYGQRTEGSATR